MDGLLHITDISWKRINHPQEVLKVGDEIEVSVLKYDEEKNRVSLGMKQLTEDHGKKLMAILSSMRFMKVRLLI